MHRSRLAAPLLGLGLILAACSSGGTTTSASPSAVESLEPSAAASVESSAVASPSPSQQPASASPSSAAGGTTVNLGETSLGSVLVDDAGMTLYIFTADTGGKSVCNDDCATNWPPLMGDAAPAVGAGLDAGKFGTITRDDGSSQITFAGMPLYYFAGDTAAGETKGQGLGEKWYVIGADGTPIK